MARTEAPGAAIVLNHDLIPAHIQQPCDTLTGVCVQAAGYPASASPATPDHSGNADAIADPGGAQWMLQQERAQHA